MNQSRLLPRIIGFLWCLDESILRNVIKRTGKTRERKKERGKGKRKRGTRGAEAIAFVTEQSVENSSPNRVIRARERETRDVF